MSSGGGGVTRHFPTRQELFADCVESAAERAQFGDPVIPVQRPPGVSFEPLTAMAGRPRPFPHHDGRRGVTNRRWGVRHSPVQVAG